MSYALVVNGAVTRTAEALPEVWRRPDCSAVAGYNLRSDLWQQDGWLPIVDSGATPGANQTGTAVLTPGATQVTRTWTNIADLPPSPRDVLIAAVNDAVSLDDLRTVVHDALAQGVI